MTRMAVTSAFDRTDGSAGPVANPSPSPDSEREAFAETAVAVCRRLLGGRAEVIGWPAGRGRKSLRLRVGDDTVIVTTRSSERRARLESHVLRALSAQGAPVPRLLGLEDRWLIQEDLGDLRLSVALNGGDPAFGESALDGALAALTRIHLAGRAAGLAREVVTIGAARDWRLRLAALPGRSRRWPSGSARPCGRSTRS